MRALPRRRSRPIYDPYPLWPGYYGAVLDTFPKDRLGQRDRRTTRIRGRHSQDRRLQGSAHRRSPVSSVRSASVPETDRARPTLPPSPTRGWASYTELNRERIYRKLAGLPALAKRRRCSRCCSVPAEHREPQGHARRLDALKARMRRASWMACSQAIRTGTASSRS
jgi:hypothetical protein